MAGRVVIFLSSVGFEATWQATSIGVTAAAMGDEVVFVVAFGALRALFDGTFGHSLAGEGAKSAQRAEHINAASPSRMLADARALGARCVACETTVRLCGLTPSELVRDRVVDEVLGLTQIWRLTEDGRVLSF